VPYDGNNRQSFSTLPMLPNGHIGVNDCISFDPAISRHEVCIVKALCFAIVFPINITGRDCLQRQVDPCRRDCVHAYVRPAGSTSGSFRGPWPTSDDGHVQVCGGARYAHDQIRRPQSCAAGEVAVASFIVPESGEGSGGIPHACRCLVPLPPPCRFRYSAMCVPCPIDPPARNLVGPFHGCSSHRHRHRSRTGG
jgi:hypothetical protein